MRNEQELIEIATEIMSKKLSKRRHHGDFPGDLMECYYLFRREVIELEDELMRVNPNEDFITDEIADCMNYLAMMVKTLNNR